MNFGPINQRGGEKRLNVIFSRAKHHMAVISSIRHQAITNDFNDGASALKNFLRYAEHSSAGDIPNARAVLENLNSLSRKSLAIDAAPATMTDVLATALRGRGYEVAAQIGQSRFRCDLALRQPGESRYTVGILVDSPAHYGNTDLLERYVMQPATLAAFGWKIMLVLARDWYFEPDAVLDRIERLFHHETHPAAAAVRASIAGEAADLPPDPGEPVLSSAPALPAESGYPDVATDLPAIVQRLGIYRGQRTQILGTDLPGQRSRRPVWPDWFAWSDTCQDFSERARRSLGSRTAGRRETPQGLHRKIKRRPQTASAASAVPAFVP